MTRSRQRAWAAGSIVMIAATCTGCQVEGVAAGGVGTPDSFRSASLEAVIGPSGACLSAGDADSRAVRPGISPCDLVRILGRPNNVVVSELPDGRRHLSMIYPGSGGTTRSYTFVAERLVSTPPRTLKETYAGRQ